MAAADASGNLFRCHLFLPASSKKMMCTHCAMTHVITSYLVSLPRFIFFNENGEEADKKNIHRSEERYIEAA